MISEYASIRAACEKVVQLLQSSKDRECLFLESGPVELGVFEGRAEESQWFMLLLVKWWQQLAVVCLCDDTRPKFVRGIGEHADHFFRIRV